MARSRPTIIAALVVITGCGGKAATSTTIDREDVRNAKYALDHVGGGNWQYLCTLVEDNDDNEDVGLTLAAWFGTEDGVSQDEWVAMAQALREECP